jgi:hypothetical protein
MNKVARILLILAVLVSVVVIVGSKTAWASPAPAAPAEKVNPASSAKIVICTTCPPTPSESRQDGINVNWQKRNECPISLLGQATLCALNPSSNVFGQIGGREDGYLSKIIQLSFTSGTARLCFGAPQGTETIYFFSNNVGVPVTTFYQDGQACADLSQSGYYILGN